MLRTLPQSQSQMFSKDGGTTKVPRSGALPCVIKHPLPQLQSKIDRNSMFPPTQRAMIKPTGLQYLWLTQRGSSSTLLPWCWEVPIQISVAGCHQILKTVSWSGLTYQNATKYCPSSDETLKGHMANTSQNIRSTKSKTPSSAKLQAIPYYLPAQTAENTNEVRSWETPI